MKNHGPCVYFDTSTKGAKGGRHNTYRADVTVGGVRYRKRDKRRRLLAGWIKWMRGGGS